MIFESLQSIQQQQQTQGNNLASLRSDTNNLVANFTETRHEVEALRETRWKQTGFLGGFVLLLEPVMHYLMKKMGAQ